MKDRNRNLRSSAASTYTTDMTAASVLDLDYPSLKRCALENILQLQRAGRISPHNHYQDLLNAIAVDIRTKHRRRIQRAKELEGVRATLSALDDKAHFLEAQLGGESKFEAGMFRQPLHQAKPTIAVRCRRKRDGEVGGEVDAGVRRRVWVT